MENRENNLTPEREPLTHLQILEGVNNLFERSYQEYLTVAKHFDAQYNRDQLEQIHDYFWNRLGGGKTSQLLYAERRKALRDKCIEDSKYLPKLEEV